MSEKKLQDAEQLLAIARYPTEARQAKDQTFFLLGYLQLGIASLIEPWIDAAEYDTIRYGAIEGYSAVR